MASSLYKGGCGGEEEDDNLRYTSVAALANDDCHEKWMRNVTFVRNMGRKTALSS